MGFIGFLQGYYKGAIRVLVFVLLVIVDIVLLVVVVRHPESQP